MVEGIKIKPTERKTLKYGISSIANPSSTIIQIDLRFWAKTLQLELTSQKEAQFIDQLSVSASGNLFTEAPHTRIVTVPLGALLWKEGWELSF